MAHVTIKYGDEFFYTEGDYDDVCKAIVEGDSLDVEQYQLGGGTPGDVWTHKRRITFFQDVDWVAVEL